MPYRMYSGELLTASGSPNVSSYSMSVFKISICDFNIQILSSTSVFKFYL
eukprot:UN00128